MDQSIILFTALFLIGLFLTGVMLTFSGRPFNVVLLTLHKLVGVAGIGTVIVLMVLSNQVASLGALEWIVGAVTVLLFIGTIATGLFLTSDRAARGTYFIFHLILPLLTLIANVALLSMLFNRTV